MKILITFSLLFAILGYRSTAHAEESVPAITPSATPIGTQSPVPSPSPGVVLQSVPHFKAETISKQAFDFPKDLKMPTAILNIGFTKSSQKAVLQCGKLLEDDFKGLVFSAAELEGVPFFIKGIVKNGIRGTIAESLQSRFLVFFEGKKELKQLLKFEEQAEDDAYVAVLKSTLESPSEYHLVFSGRCTGDQGLDQKLRRDLLERVK